MAILFDLPAYALDKPLSGGVSGARRLLCFFTLCLVLAIGGADVLAENARVNINADSPEILSEGLVGIGLAKAYRIVEHREAYGPFESVEELVEVKGIGEAIIAKNRARIVLE